MESPVYNTVKLEEKPKDLVLVLIGSILKKSQISLILSAQCIMSCFLWGSEIFHPLKVFVLFCFVLKIYLLIHVFLYVCIYCVYRHLSPFQSSWLILFNWFYFLGWKYWTSCLSVVLLVSCVSLFLNWHLLHRQTMDYDRAQELEIRGIGLNAIFAICERNDCQNFQSFRFLIRFFKTWE